MLTSPHRSNYKAYHVSNKFTSTHCETSFPHNCIAFAISLPITTHHQPTVSKCNPDRRAHLSACLAQSLDDAVSRGYVLPFGRVIKLDNNGHFPENSCIHLSQQLKAQLNPVVQVIVRKLKPANVRAIYLRGSFATGNCFHDGTSDLDLIVITAAPLAKSKRSTVTYAVSVIAKKFAACAADICYLTEVDLQMNGEGPRYLYVNMMLMQYSALLYGSHFRSLRWVDCKSIPADELAVDIRNDETKFLQCFENGIDAGDFAIQCEAIRWICKRALRAVVNLASHLTRRHSRDLFPSYKIAAEAYPQYSSTFLAGLQCACANAKTGYSGLSEEEFLKRGYSIARQLVEIVEELYLLHNFGSLTHSHHTGLQAVVDGVLPTPNFLESAGELAEECVARILSWGPGPMKEWVRGPYLRADLPELALKRRDIGRCTESRDGVEESCRKRWIGRVLQRHKEPLVFRACTSRLGREGNESVESILNGMRRKYVQVECRVSPKSEVTFCRASHPWIASGKFTPPSVLVSLPLDEAIARMGQNCELWRLQYKQSLREYIYIQTRAHKRDQLFDLRGLDLRIAQKERIWISTHGTVSGLHYDGSYSVLLQRTGKKRMVFFSADWLGHMGIYPLGHPLHRRGRVSLSRRETGVFREFWERGGSKVVEVVLEAGDMVVFPPFWSHYTESIAEEDEGGLSISHTLRYV